MQGDPLWIQGFLAVHIGAGALCLALAPMVLAVTKGSPRHRRWGRVYYWAMAVLTVTALVMAAFRPVLFLAFIAVLSFYLTFSGRRVLRLKDMARGGSAKFIDWFAAILAFAACACLAGLAFLRPAWVQHMGIVAVILGAVGMRTAGVDMVRFVYKPKDPMFWLFAHLEKFMASYIAVWTAFSVVTLPQVFPHAGIVLWLWPTAVGAPAIALASVYYRRKFRGAPSREPAVARA
jgi:uncharacterized membrane protein